MCHTECGYSGGSSLAVPLDRVNILTISRQSILSHPRATAESIPPRRLVNQQVRTDSEQENTVLARMQRRVLMQP